MRMYYLELLDEEGETIFESGEFFKTKNKAKEWAYINLNFQNGYHSNLFLITCENKTAKNTHEFFEEGYDDIESEEVF